jgi:hypothetical protein
MTRFLAGALADHTLSSTRAGCLLAGVIALAIAPLGTQAQVSVQMPGNVIGSGSNSFHYLVMEGESFIDSTKVAAPGTGFVKLYNDAALTSFLGNPMLSTDTGASMGGALGTIGPAFTRFADFVTYQVVFTTPGDYYMYMRFTMFENGGNTMNYISEDSFVFPPDFNKDPQNDWVPAGNSGADDGGYCEGCCSGAGFLYILDYQGNGSRTDHSGEDSATPNGTNYWEGKFHWNQLFASQFLNPTTITNADGTPRASNPFHYVVTPGMVGVPQFFTIAYREQGVTIDQWLFSTHTNMMNDYTQDQLDQFFVNKVQVQDAGNIINTPSNSWSYLVMEAEEYMAKSNHNANVGFTAVSPGSTNISFYGAPILDTNTTASGKAALFTQTPGAWADKVNYQVQFAYPGDYYLYMHFTMYENGGNTTHYINEDSFFVPPAFNKDPQFDWVPDWTAAGNGTDGGYCEGFDGISGFLFILDFQGNGSRTDHSGETSATPNGTNYWEGKFHWNQLYSSQFLNPAIFTNADGSTQVAQPFHYVVTPGMVGVPQNFAVGLRENGVTPDLWLFSTHTNMMNDYPQDTLDQIILQPKLYLSQSGGNVTIAWPASARTFILESTSSLSPTSWTAVQTPGVISGNRINVTVGATGTQYYRLRQP